MSMKNFALGALAAGVMALSSVSSHAAKIQLGFVLDESGSISTTEWNTIRNGLASAIGLIPVSGPDEYYLSVVTFDDNSNTRITNTLVTSSNIASLQAQIAGFSQGAGFTNYEAGFAAMQTALGNTSTYDFSYVNFATDGEPNRCGAVTPVVADQATARACATTARNNLVNAGVDNISIEGIGVTAANASFLQSSICYPTPCDTASPYDFPTHGFYIAVANATEYAAAIRNKILVVTNQTPEPTSLALVGLALAGIGAASRRRKA